MRKDGSMELKAYPRMIRLTDAAGRFGLTARQLRDRILAHNARATTMDQVVRREHGLVAVEDLALLFPEADPQEEAIRRGTAGAAEVAENDETRQAGEA